MDRGALLVDINNRNILLNRDACGGKGQWGQALCTGELRCDFDVILCAIGFSWRILWSMV